MKSITFVDSTLHTAHELSRLINGLIAILSPFLVPLPIALLVAYDMFLYVLPHGMPLTMRLFASGIGALSIEFFSVVTFSFIEKVKVYNVNREADAPEMSADIGYLGIAVNIFASGAMITVGGIFPAYGWDATKTAAFIPYGFLLIAPLATYFMLQMATIEHLMKHHAPMSHVAPAAELPKPKPMRAKPMPHDTEPPMLHVAPVMSHDTLAPAPMSHVAEPIIDESEGISILPSLYSEPQGVKLWDDLGNDEARHAYYLERKVLNLSDEVIADELGVHRATLNRVNKKVRATNSNGFHKEAA